jgi:hypothetical protein
LLSDCGGVGVITEGQHVVLSRIQTGKKRMCGMDVLFNLANKELIDANEDGSAILLTNKGQMVMDKYEAGL